MVITENNFFSSFFGLFSPFQLPFYTVFALFHGFELSFVQ